MEHIYVTPDDRLQKVFDAAAPGSVIHLAPGVYRQKTVIRTPELTILGAGAGKTRIVFDDYARKRDEQGTQRGYPPPAPNYAAPAAPYGGYSDPAAPAAPSDFAILEDEDAHLPF